MKEKGGQMQANDIMISQVYKVKESERVKSVIEKFSDHWISRLPIVNERNEIVAYISDGDIMRYIGKKQMNLDFFIILQLSIRWIRSSSS
jgi:predicted transcriptional regulator